MKLTHPLTSILELKPKELLKQCLCSYFQSSGSGGQKRNKVKSSVRLQLSLNIDDSNPIEFAVTATKSRSSEQNLSKALHKMRLALALSLATHSEATSKKDEEKAPSHPLLPDTWPPFRYPVHEAHPDLPQIAYRVLSLFVAYKGKVRETAQAIHTTSSTLIKFLYTHKTLWEVALVCRKKFDLSPLKTP